MSLKQFQPDLPPSGRYIRQRVLVGGDPHNSRVIEVRLGQRADRRDYEPSRCLASRRRVGGQCGRFPAAPGRAVCIVHGASSMVRQRDGRAMAPEVSGAIGRAIRDVRHGHLKLDDVARFFPELQEKVEEYRKDPECIDLCEDAIDLTVLKELLLSGTIPADVGYVMKTVPQLIQAKARVLTARDAIESRNSVPIEKVLQLLGQMTDILRRNVPEERHEFVARELRMLGTNPIPEASGR